MTLMPGHSCWAVRLSTEDEDDWTSYTLGAPVGDPGGTARVYRIAANSTPPLLAKVYHSDSLLDRIARDQAYAQRLLVLGLARVQLMRELPFCAWPRRIIFSKREPADTEVAASIVGLTVPELDRHRSLTDVFRDASCRSQMTQERGIHIAITLADQLHRMHHHPWQFVIGDLSPNNIFVDLAFSSVHFIDLDVIGFTPLGQGVTFDTPGSTPSFRSPEYFSLNGQGRLTTAHDDFVLAILLFQLLMAISGVDSVHPFLDLDTSEDDNIRQGRFPYVDGLREHLVPDHPAAVYAGWHVDLRAAFEAVFTGRRHMTGHDWADLLARFRRSLR